jgi:hypothetical protein
VKKILYYKHMEDITLKYILENAIPHPIFEGKQTIIQRGKFLVCIAGGKDGLCGDFETTFEVTVLDRYGNSVTENMVPSARGPVIGWVDKEHLIEIVNTIPC